MRALHWASHQSPILLRAQLFAGHLNGCSSAGNSMWGASNTVLVLLVQGELYGASGGKPHKCLERARAENQHGTRVPCPAGELSLPTSYCTIAAAAAAPSQGPEPLDPHQGEPLDPHQGEPSSWSSSQMDFAPSGCSSHFTAPLIHADPLQASPNPGTSGQ